MKYAPLVRIILRYVAGAGLFGSAVIGERLAADPDVVMVGSITLGVVIEGGYAWAKRYGGAT